MSAPEVLACREKREPIIYSFAADVFMFGMALYEVMEDFKVEQRIWNLPGIRITLDIS